MRLTTIIALCMISIAVFAAKAPKGKLLSYSHITINPEALLEAEFNLNWKDGKGILKTSERIMPDENKYTTEVSEEVFRQVADIIKKKKLYAIKQKKSDSTSDSGKENITIKFEDMVIECDGNSLNEKQREALYELEVFIKEVDKGMKAPTSELIECSWACMPTRPAKGGRFEYLSYKDGQGAVLKIGETTEIPNNNEEQQYAVTEEDMKKLSELIVKEKIYLVDGHDGRDLSDQSFRYYLSLQYADGAVYRATCTQRHQPNEMKKALESIDGFLTSVAKTSKPYAFYPKGKMIYCSCSFTNYGLPAGELRYSYYEMKADEGTKPKVVYCEDRGSGSKKTEYPATAQDVEKLSNVLRDMNIFMLNGYNVDEQMTGGTSYRIHMEFSSGEKLTAYWFTHEPKPLAIDAYGTISRYLNAITTRP